MKNALSLRPFQKKFLRGFLAPGKTCGVLSIPRGNGKSTFAAHLVARVLSPGDPLYREGLESVLCAASLEQARIVFKIAREGLNNPHLGRNAIGCGSKIRFEDLSER